MRNRRDANVLKSALDRELQAVSRSHRSAKLLQAENSSDAEQGAPLLDETVLPTALERDALVLQDDRAIRPRRVVVPIDIDVEVRVRRDLGNGNAAPWVDGDDEDDREDRRRDGRRRRRTTNGRRRGRTTGRDFRRTRDERFETGRDRDGRRTTAGGRRGRTTGRDRRRSPGRRRETGGREE